MITYLCDRALVDGRVWDQVLLTVVDGRFQSMQTEAPAESRRGAIRLQGVVIPGMANTHSHAFHRALRSRTQQDRGSFWTWRELMYAAASRLDPVSYHRLARATFAEMVTAGITAVGEFHYVHHQPDGRPYADPNAMGDALFSAAAEAGLRITLLDTLYLHGGLNATGHSPPSGAQLRYSDQTVAGWIDRVSELSPGPNQQVGAAIHSVRAVDAVAVKEVAEWAGWAASGSSGRPGAVVHAHVSEQRMENERCSQYYGVTPVELLHGAGVLNERFTAVHATHLTPRDIELLAASGSTVCMCPTTERDLGDGIGPSSALISANVSLSLGSDSHAVIDHFEECRAVELNERLRSEVRGTHAAADLLQMAVGGHASIGWPDAGSIAVGDRADLVAIRLDSLRTAGSTSVGSQHSGPIEAVVFAATASDVTDVIVDGEHLVQGGRHVALDVAAELDASVSHLFPAA